VLLTYDIGWQIASSQDGQRALGGGLFGGVVAREGSITESTFDGSVLISTGVLDPLNDARDRTMRFGALRKGISIDECQAGQWYVNVT
jgi:hypothetical protein